jgi:parallel beta-helix repeat protein
MANVSVTTLADSGAGSLREAIQTVNASGDAASTITFAVAGTIVLDSALTPITAKVTIDGTTAPGHVAGGPPVVGINCNGNIGPIFNAGSDGSQLLGMSVGGSSGQGVALIAGDITLDGNYIGLDVNGAALGNSGTGVLVLGTSTGNHIGINPTGTVGYVSNVISGNGADGITLIGSTDNTIRANYIGTDPTGTVAIGNTGNGVRLMDNSTGNLIGGTLHTDPETGDVNNPTGNGTDPRVGTFVVPSEGNLISGNGGNGVEITESNDNSLAGNFIGTAAGGNSALGNGGDGVLLSGSDFTRIVGCDILDNPFVYYNVISGNGGNGLHITNSDGTVVQANFFGTSADNAQVIGNANNGILVDGDSSSTMIGGEIPLGNVTGGNGANGIAVVDTASTFTSFNTFGGLHAFGGPAPNGLNGLLITSTGGGQVIQTNAFSGNTLNGIQISGDASGILLEPNMVGLTTSGDTAMPNGGNGLLISGTAHDITVGGNTASILPRNVFSANAGFGIAIIEAAHDVTITNSYVGTDVQGMAGLGNTTGGIFIGGTVTDTIIGGTPSGPDTPVLVLVSGNVGPGIILADGTTNTQVLNNIIGFEIDGTTLLPNGVAELLVGEGSSGNTITGNTIACFLAGTRIATQHGEVAVEDLREGMMVRTASGALRPVAWVGQRRIDCRRYPNPHQVWPVRVLRGAFAEGVPARDLYLSADHAVAMDGVLIPIRHLVNGRTVLRERRHEVHYFHVELDAHDVLLAEGLPCESFLDTGNRSDFENAGTVVTLHPMPALQVWHDKACLPLVQEGAHVEAARSVLLERAAAMGFGTTREAGVHLEADGQVIEPVVDGRHHRFHVPAGVKAVRLVSRSAVPAELHAESEDKRRMGIGVSGVWVDGTRLALTDRRLAGGWHAAESLPGGAAWRWTEGNAVIVLPPGTGARVVDVAVRLTERYWADAPALLATG